MKDPDISEVAKQSGVPASTLRYYEEKGLIASNGRRGLKRTFDPDVFEKLGLIALGRASGFTLDEIAAMMSPDGPRIDRMRLIEHASAILPAIATGRHRQAKIPKVLTECVVSTNAVIMCVGDKDPEVLIDGNSTGVRVARHADRITPGRNSLVGVKVV